MPTFGLNDIEYGDKEGAVYVLKIGDKYLKYSGRCNCKLVDIPAHATIYIQRGDAEYRLGVSHFLFLRDRTLEYGQRKVNPDEIRIMKVILGRLAETEA